MVYWLTYYLFTYLLTVQTDVSLLPQRLHEGQDELAGQVERLALRQAARARQRGPGGALRQAEETRLPGKEVR